MANIALDPVSKAFVMYDILNEPDSQNLGWDFMTKAYLDVMEQGSAINPGASFHRQDTGVHAVLRGCLSRQDRPCASVMVLLPLNMNRDYKGRLCSNTQPASCLAATCTMPALQTRCTLWRAAARGGWEPTGATASPQTPASSTRAPPTTPTSSSPPSSAPATSESICVMSLRAPHEVSENHRPGGTHVHDQPDNVTAGFKGILMRESTATRI